MTGPEVDDQVEAPDPVDELADAAASWGPTFGPETEDDITLRRTKHQLDWHPPGGPW